MILRAFSAIVLCLACLVAVAGPPNAEESQVLHGIGRLEPAIIRHIGQELWFQDLAKYSRRISHSPEYLKLTCAPYLVERLADNRRVVTHEYEWQAGSHDLRDVGARAAWLLESVFSFDLPTIDGAATKAHRVRSQEFAKLQLNAYRAGVMQAVRSYEVGKDLDRLIRKYQAKIQEGTEEYPSYGFHMHAGPHLRAMFDEFFPLGKKLTDLETIIGRKAHSLEPKLRDRQSSKDVTGVFEFLYQNGFSGEAFFFLVKDGVIEGVNVQSID